MFNFIYVSIHERKKIMFCYCLLTLTGKKKCDVEGQLKREYLTLFILLLTTEQQR